MTLRIFICFVILLFWGVNYSQINQIVYNPEIIKNRENGFYVYGETLNKEFIFVKLDNNFNQLASIKLPFEKVNGILENVIILKDQLFINFSRCKLDSIGQKDYEFNSKVILPINLDSAQYHYQHNEEESNMCKEVINRAESATFIIFDFQLDYYCHFYDNDYLYVLIDYNRHKASTIDTTIDYFQEIFIYEKNPKLYVVKYKYELVYIKGFPTFIYSEIDKINLGKMDNLGYGNINFVQKKDVILTKLKRKKIQLVKLNLQEFEITKKSKQIKNSNSFYCNESELASNNFYFLQCYSKDKSQQHILFNEDLNLISSFRIEKNKNEDTTNILNHLVQINNKTYTVIFERDKISNKLEVNELRIADGEIKIKTISYDSLINCFPNYGPNYLIDWYIHNDQFIYLAFNNQNKDFFSKIAVDPKNSCHLDSINTTNLYSEWYFGQYYMSENGNNLFWIAFDDMVKYPINNFFLKVVTK